MRENKFRAWDKRKKLMLSWLELVTMNDEPSLLDLENDNFEWLQFTGLKDKHGVEIYEGHILKRTEEGLYPITLKNVVTWNDNLAMFELGGFSLGLLLQASRKDKREYEVIGNKFENPELL